MSQLSAQSIHKKCQPTKWFGLRKQQPMVDPYFPDKRISTNGRSFGLSGASYDVRIDHDLVLGVHPGIILARSVLEGWQLPRIKEELENNPPHFALANTMEDFFMPHNVVGYVVDKSSYARVFVSAFNTLIDPGFQGNLTLELVNLGDEPVSYGIGDAVCQIGFDWLDRKTKFPYGGKYQHQSRRPVGARFEHTEGGNFQESNYGKRPSTSRQSDNG